MFGSWCRMLSMSIFQRTFALCAGFATNAQVQHYLIYSNVFLLVTFLLQSRDLLLPCLSIHMMWIHIPFCRRFPKTDPFGTYFRPRQQWSTPFDAIINLWQWNLLSSNDDFQVSREIWHWCSSLSRWAVVRIQADFDRMSASSSSWWTHENTSQHHVQKQFSSFSSVAGVSWTNFKVEIDFLHLGCP